jgi:cellulose synthase/poly-beta-1,6-N-acetylglucosamine synthase-like glycosyltransferase
MLYVLLSISVSYVLLHIIFFFGYLRSKNCIKLKGNDKCKVTVIVAARNEENNVANCINSLKKLNYPPDLLEIILVNDNSTDNTKKIMLDTTLNDIGFIVLDSPISSNSNLKGKPNAIDIAIAKSTGEIIFITDADCEVPCSWIRNTINYYSDNSVGMVCGFTNIKKSNKVFSKLQSLDWIYLLSLASCSSGIFKPVSCIGNNISFRKNAYNEIGGYKSIKFSITEDMALMNAVVNSDRYIVKFPVDSGCLISTEPCSAIRELYNQKKRWFKGGVGINPLGYILGIELYIMNLILMFGLFFINPLNYLLLLIMKMISELMIIIPVYKKLNFKNLFIYFPLYQIYFGIYGLLLPFTFLLGNKIDWKGRKY